MPRFIAHKPTAGTVPIIWMNRAHHCSLNLFQAVSSLLLQPSVEHLGPIGPKLICTLEIAPLGIGTLCLALPRCPTLPSRKGRQLCGVGAAATTVVFSFCSKVFENAEGTTKRSDSPFIGRATLLKGFYTLICDTATSRRPMEHNAREMYVTSRRTRTSKILTRQTLPPEVAATSGNPSC